MQLSLIHIRVTSSLVMVGALFFLASFILNSVQSHHVRGIPGGWGSSSGDPCDCPEKDDYGDEVDDDEDFCEDEGRSKYKNHTCPVDAKTGKLICASNKGLRCPGNRERCCLSRGTCGCPDPCDASKCRPVASTTLVVHNVTVVTMSSTKIRQRETGLKCDPLSNRLVCCKNSVCSKLPEVALTPETMNTFDGAVCNTAGDTVLQYYANVTEVILFWAFGRERYGKETDGGFGDLVGEVIDKLLGRTPNSLNLPFNF